MKLTLKATGRHESGSIAVEAALVLPILLLFLGLPSIFYAFYFRQYTAVEKAAHDAAIYLSTAPRLEMTTVGPDGNFVAVTLAKRIIAKELAGIVPADVPVDPVISCMYLVGQGKTPQMNGCSAQVFKGANNTLFRMDVAINVPYINPMTGSEVESMYMSPTAPVRYLGN